jgi:glycosyltransferase involved in cell wall biosynthesis
MVINTSVIITSYNKEKFLARCIRSCLKQSLNPASYEVIVVDDASTDNSRKIIKGFGNKVKPIFLKKNVGVAEASNVGIKAALGSFVIRVDADDYINENMLLFMTQILIDNLDIGFVYGDHFLVNEREDKDNRLNLNTIDKLFRHGAGIMFRKSNLEAIGLYDSDLRNAEDYDLLTRYLKNFDGYYLRLPLYRYRQHKNNMTKDVLARKRWEEKVDAKNR